MTDSIAVELPLSSTYHVTVNMWQQVISVNVLLHAGIKRLNKQLFIASVVEHIYLHAYC